MIRENDFVKRELQRLQILLNHLIGLVVDKNEVDIILQETTDLALLKNFGISFNQLLKLEKDDFQHQLESWHETHLDLLVKLLLSWHNNQNESASIYAQKAVLVLDFLNENSTIFSFERMQWRSQLSKA